MFLCLHELINSVILLMQFLSDSSINNAYFKHNLHVIVPGLDFFLFLVFSKLICSSCFHFLICLLLLKVQLLVCTGRSYVIWLASNCGVVNTDTLRSYPSTVFQNSTGEKILSKTILLESKKIQKKKFEKNTIKII